MTEPIDAARRLIADAGSVVVLSGAGMSAESGIPTFRDALTGLWSRLHPEQLATPQAWRANRELVWAWYSSRAIAVTNSTPNAGHRAVAELGTRATVTVVTQNVDDLHERAGSKQVLHLHGSLFAPRCEACDAPYPLPDATPTPFDGTERIPPPRCLLCDAAIRPGVVWFGENLPTDTWLAAEAAVSLADVMIVVGTSGTVYPAAALPERAAADGVAVIEINPDPTGLAGLAAVTVAMTAATALPALV